MADLDVDTIDSLLEAQLKREESRRSQTPDSQPSTEENGKAAEQQVDLNQPSSSSSKEPSSGPIGEGADKERSERERSEKDRERDRERRESRHDRDHERDRDRDRDRDYHRSSRHSRKRSRSRSRSRDRDRSYRRHRHRSPSPRDRDRDYYHERERRDREYYYRERRHRSRSRERRDRHEEEKKEEPVLSEEEQRIRDEKTAFISNLPIRATKEDLIDFFDSKCGGVVDVRVITDKVTKKSKGVAYVEFKTKEGMQVAMGLAEKRIQGQTFFVQPTFAEKNIIAAARQKQMQMMQQQQNVMPFPGMIPPQIFPLGPMGIPHPGLPPPVSTLNPLQRITVLGPTRLVATQLHELTTEADLVKIFSAIGEVPAVDVQFDDQGRSKGYAFIKYTKAEMARRALIKFDGLEIAGRRMRVREMRDDINSIDELDDDDGNIKTKMDQKARVNLMHKLQKPGTEIEVPTGVLLPVKLVPRHTTCIKIVNAFDPAEETGTSWEKELRDDFVEECTNKFGPVETCILDKSTKLVFIRFFEVQHAQHAIQVLHGRWFGGRQLTVEFIDEKEIPKQ